MDESFSGRARRIAASLRPSDWPPLIPGKWTTSYWRTTTFRLTVLFSVLFALGVIALLELIYWQTAGYMTRQVDHILDIEASALVQQPEADLRHSLTERIDQDLRHIYFYGLFDANGRRITGNIPELPTELPIDSRLYLLRHVLDKSDWHSQARVTGIRLASGEVLVLGRDVAQLDEIRRIIIRALEWWGSFTLVVGLCIGISLSVRPLKRIGDIQKASRVIILGDISARLPIAGVRDELDMLASIVNRMLDEIERLMSEVKSVCDSIAHDLRTPLTRLRAQLYRLQQNKGLNTSQLTLVEQAVFETDALLARFRALLRISEIEDQRRRVGFGNVLAAKVLTDAIELYEPLADEKQITLRASIAQVPMIRADGELLFEALSNLMDNAIKFSPASSTVLIDLMAGENGPCIEIIDEGPGITDEERETVLQRFYRGSRNQDQPGHGLGLSIVAAIIRLHDFTLEIDTVPEGGTRVRLSCWPKILPMV